MLPQDPEWETGLSPEDVHRYVDLHNKHLHGVNAGVMKNVLLYAGTSEEFTRIEVLDSGTAFPSVEATPVSFAEEFADPTVLESLDFTVPQAMTHASEITPSSKEVFTTPQGIM